MLGHTVTLCLAEEPPDCVSKRLNHFPFPPAVCKDGFLHILAITCHYLTF